MELRKNGTKTNHHKGIAAAYKVQKRKEAEERNAAYQKLSFEDKLARHKEGGKAWTKLILQKEAEQAQAKAQEKKKKEKRNDS